VVGVIFVVSGLFRSLAPPLCGEQTINIDLILIHSISLLPFLFYSTILRSWNDDDIIDGTYRWGWGHVQAS
jgi:hypothetical protein